MPKTSCVHQDHYDDERNKTVFHNTTPDLQDQDRGRFLVPDRSCPKTDSLRPHHWKNTSETWQTFSRSWEQSQIVLTNLCDCNLIYMSVDQWHNNLIITRLKITS